DLRDRRALRRPARQGVHRRVPGGLHLRGRPDDVHPPRRVRRLRGVRAGLPGRGHLLRGRRARAVDGVHQGQRRLVRRPGQPGRGVEGRQGRPRRRAGREPAAPAARRV
ncbi:MAG: 4Fe-4S ferredoxin, iron-sulfur binding, partial [uncultured Pseudonocardia sp.]